MEPYESPHYRTTKTRPRDFLDAYLHYGPCAAAKLAADERQAAARHWAAVWSAALPVQARTPGAWRRWLGVRLVRAGTRLHGSPPLAAELTPTTG
jgi:hypothetical protein